MGDAAGDCCSILCGGCCLAIFSTLTAFCSTKTYGAGSGSGGNTGCCGKCFKSSFDEDGFEDEVRKDMEKTRDPNAKVREPEAVPPMSTTQTPPLPPSPPSPSSPPTLAQPASIPAQPAS
ncbi:hypothetical protein D9619_009630 [Psilocybe cf. subviscida]|uniref:Uncharacterized protein n=1 Tax=Psilocybe cf. subviscida TaxID=2480587 RepID=A0A8H5BLK3_9AGAR|nr:hypothetical protein D9619_009630 [Psilocybe cf. subviscida]